MDIHQLHFIGRQHGVHAARQVSGHEGSRVLSEQVLLGGESQQEQLQLSLSSSAT